MRKRWTVADVAPNKPLCFKAAAAATQHLCELCDRNLLGHRRVPEVDVLYVPEERTCESSVAWAPQCNQLQVGSAIDEICGDRICGGRGGGGGLDMLERSIRFSFDFLFVSARNNANGGAQRPRT